MDAQIAALEERLLKLKRLARLTRQVRALELDPVAEMDDDACIAEIMNLVTERFQVTENDILGRERHARFIWPRYLVAWLLRRCTLGSYEYIARRMRRTNHTTIYYAVLNVDQRVSVEPDFAAIASQLEKDARRAIAGLGARKTADGPLTMDKGQTE